MSREALGGRSFLPERVSLNWGRSPKGIVGERLFLSVWPQPSGRLCRGFSLLYPPLISVRLGHPGSGTLRPRSFSFLLRGASLVRMRNSAVVERAAGWRIM